MSEETTTAEEKPAKLTTAEFPIPHIVEVGEKVIVKVTKADIKKFYEGEGVTKAVTDTIAAAEEKLMTMAYPMLGKLVAKEQKAAKMVIGKGDNVMTLGVGGAMTVAAKMPEKNKKLETKTIYGRMSVSMKRSIPLALRPDSGGMTNEIESMVRKAWKK